MVAVKLFFYLWYLSVVFIGVLYLMKTSVLVVVAQWIWHSVLQSIRLQV